MDPILQLKWWVIIQGAYLLFPTSNIYSATAEYREEIFETTLSLPDGFHKGKAPMNFTMFCVPQNTELKNHPVIVNSYLSLPLQ